MKRIFLAFFIVMGVIALSLVMLNGCTENPTEDGAVVPGVGISKIYLANMADGVYIFDVAKGTVESTVTFEGATKLYGIALSPDKSKLYALSDNIFDTSSATGEIFSYNLKTGAMGTPLTQTYTDSNESFGNYILGFSADGSKMYVPMRGKVGIYTISTNPLAIDKVASIEESCNGITGGVVPGDGHVYFGNFVLGKIYRYDIALNTVEASIILPGSDITWFIRLNPYDDLIYAPSVYGDSIDRINYKTSFSYKDRYDVTAGGIPIDVSFSNNGWAYASLFGSCSVEVFNYRSGDPVKTISISGVSPNNIIIDDVNRRAYVNGYDAPQLLLINTVNNSFITSYVLPGTTDATAYK